MVVRISHIELTSGEFRIVGEVDSFVSKLSSDLIDTFKAADDELFQI